MFLAAAFCTSGRNFFWMYTFICRFKIQNIAVAIDLYTFHRCLSVDFGLWHTNIPPHLPKSQAYSVNLSVEGFTLNRNRMVPRKTVLQDQINMLMTQIRS